MLAPAADPRPDMPAPDMPELLMPSKSRYLYFFARGGCSWDRGCDWDYDWSVRFIMRVPFVELALELVKLLLLETRRAAPPL